MSKSWQPHARHILDAIAKIRRIQARGDLAQDDILYDAALRNLQTLSESTQHLPDDQKAAWPDVPWRDITGEAWLNADSMPSHFWHRRRPADTDF